MAKQSTKVTTFLYSSLLGSLFWFTPWRSAHLSTTMRLPFWDMLKYKRPCLRLTERDCLQTCSRHSWVRTVTTSCLYPTKPSGLNYWQHSMPYKAKSLWQLNLSTKSSKWEKIQGSGTTDWSPPIWGFSNKPRPQHWLPASWAYCETVTSCDVNLHEINLWKTELWVYNTTCVVPSPPCSGERMM